MPHAIGLARRPKGPMNTQTTVEANVSPKALLVVVCLHHNKYWRLWNRPTIMGRLAGCPSHLTVSSYRDLLHQLPHAAPLQQTRGAALYVTAVVVFYVALLLVLVGGGLRRRAAQRGTSTSGRRHILTYSPNSRTATPALADHHPQPSPSATQV